MDLYIFTKCMLYRKYFRKLIQLAIIIIFIQEKTTQISPKLELQITAIYLNFEISFDIMRISKV